MITRNKLSSWQRRQVSWSYRVDITSVVLCYVLYWDICCIMAFWLVKIEHLILIRGREYKVFGHNFRSWGLPTFLTSLSINFMKINNFSFFFFFSLLTICQVKDRMAIFFSYLMEKIKCQWTKSCCISYFRKVQQRCC